MLSGFGDLVYQLEFLKIYLALKFSPYVVLIYVMLTYAQHFLTFFVKPCSYKIVLVCALCYIMIFMLSVLFHA